MLTSSTKATCHGCQGEFPSRNAVFKHLEETNGACLDAQQAKDFLKYHEAKRKKLKEERVLILYGYHLPSSSVLVDDHGDVDDDSIPRCIRNGQDAAELLLQIMWQVDHKDDDDDEDTQDDSTNNTSKAFSYQRSYGHSNRQTHIVAQDEGTGAVSECMSTKLLPLPKVSAAADKNADDILEDWIQRVNQAAVNHLSSSLPKEESSPESSSTATAAGANNTCRVPILRVFGRLKLPGPCTKFNAELDVNHRRVEYLLPADFLYPPPTSSTPKTTTNLPCSVFGPDQTRLEFFQSFASFTDATRAAHHHQQQPASDGGTEQQHRQKKQGVQGDGSRFPHPATVTYLYALKKIMQRLTTPIVEVNVNDPTAVMEKERNEKARLKSKYKINSYEKKGDDKKDDNADQVDNADQGDDGDNDKNQSNATSTTENNNTETHPACNNKSSSSSPSKQQAKKKQRKEKRSKKKKKNGDDDNNDDDGATGGKGKNMLQRKRYHNFTPTVMAHEYLAYRRLDRLYHRATLRFDQDTDTGTCHLRSTASPGEGGDGVMDVKGRPFFSISLRGDIFLKGQACRIIGLVIALVRGLVDEDFVDCVFDQHYPHLVPTPPAPTCGLYAVDAYYMTWEGKAKAILSPRPTTRYADGFNQESILAAVDDWERTMREKTVQVWLSHHGSYNAAAAAAAAATSATENDDSRLIAEKEWTENVLEPWAIKARKQLEDYRRWKKATASVGAVKGTPTTETVSGTGAATTAVANEPTNSTAETAEPSASLSLVSSSLDTVDPTVPELYEAVLYYLRKANESGLWPSTTPKRQMVMISSLTEEAASAAKKGDNGDEPQNSAAIQHPTSLSLAHVRAKSNNNERISPYVFEQGEGGASGSFSVGAMPGDYAQPKGNQLFPELTKAAFELELKLRPDREPSSTIAINRNAQFRPHTDNGAGAGQSTSLIVGLGTYAGGELVVEGEQKDIRYKAVEFDGWNQRHWTMPFAGERFSLVWFTPKGCEGLRGIDICP